MNRKIKNIKIKQILITMLPLIAQIESNNDTSKIGDGGRSLGHLQIQKEAVQDVNDLIGYNKYSHQEMSVREAAEEVFVLYLKKWADVYYVMHGCIPTEEELARIWNGGPFGYRKDSTLPYLQKYKTLKNNQ